MAILNDIKMKKKNEGRIRNNTKIEIMIINSSLVGWKNIVFFGFLIRRLIIFIQWNKNNKQNNYNNNNVNKGKRYRVDGLFEFD